MFTNQNNILNNAFHNMKENCEIVCNIHDRHCPVKICLFNYKQKTTINSLFCIIDIIDIDSNETIFEFIALESKETSSTQYQKSKAIYNICAYIKNITKNKYHAYKEKIELFIDNSTKQPSFAYYKLFDYDGFEKCSKLKIYI